MSLHSGSQFISRVRNFTTSVWPFCQVKRSVPARVSTHWVAVHFKSEKFYYLRMAIPCCWVKRSVLVRVSTHWVTAHFKSKELSTSLWPPSAAKWRGVSLPMSLHIGSHAVHFKSEKLYYICMIISCSQVKRGVLVRVSTHWVTEQYKSEKLYYIFMTTMCRGVSLPMSLHIGSQCTSRVRNFTIYICMTIPCCRVKRSILHRVSAHWVSGFQEWETLLHLYDHSVLPSEEECSG